MATRYWATVEAVMLGEKEKGVSQHILADETASRQGHFFSFAFPHIWPQSAPEVVIVHPVHGIPHIVRVDGQTQATLNEFSGCHPSVSGSSLM